MKSLTPLFFVLFISLVSGSAVFSQQKMGGTVIEVIDGKTMIIEVTTGKLTAVLQYIEVPEPDQRLNQTVKDHLANLVLGKYVSFEPRGIMPAKTLGQVYLNGVDIGQQMIRDGAAWHVPAAKTGQSQDESDSYENYQALARSEKRGVWSIQDLKPAWEFRAEKQERARREEELQWEKAAVASRNARPGSMRTGGNTTSGISNAGALINLFDPATRNGSLRTPVLGIKDLNEDYKTAGSVAYFYHEDGKGVRTGAFYIYLAALSEKARFQSTSMVLTVDGKNIATGTAKRTQRKVDSSIEETLIYTVDRKAMEQFANGSEASLTIGSYRIVFLPGYQMLLYNLLDASK